MCGRIPSVFRTTETVLAELRAGTSRPGDGGGPRQARRRGHGHAAGHRGADDDGLCSPPRPRHARRAGAQRRHTHVRKCEQLRRHNIQLGIRRAAQGGL